MSETAARAARRIQEHARVAPGQLPFVLRTVVGSAVLGVGANVVGAVVVGLLLFAVDATGTRHQSLVLVASGAVATVVSAALGTTAAFLVQKRTLRWVLRGEIPDETDARRAVRMPLDMAVIDVVLWALDAIAISVVAWQVGVPERTIVGIAGGIVIAGLSATGVTYLVIARVGAPVIRMALAAHPPSWVPMVSVRARLLLIWVLTSAVPVLGIVLILFTPGNRPHVKAAAAVAALVGLAVGAGSTALAARAIGKPLRGLARVLQRVGRGELDLQVDVEEPGEIGLLQTGVNEMLYGLRERDRVQDLFGRHVGPAVAAAALQDGVTLSGESRTAVALFVDITGSTAMALTRDPREFVATLNRFFEIVVGEVEANGGLVNKFEGDGALCIFGVPVSLDDAPTAALRAARRIRDRVATDGEVRVGIGVASGPVVAGQVGTASRLEYTVIGDAVNEAARLTEAAKSVPGCLLATDAVVARASEAERQRWCPDGTVTLRGRGAATRTFTA